MSRALPWADLPLRLATALVFFLHGYPKILAPGQTAEFFGGLGIPLPFAAARIVGLVETLGAALLALGLFTRWVATAQAIDMAMALLLVKAAAGFPRAEIDLVLLGSSLLFATNGAGTISLDRLFGRGGGARPADPWKI